MLIGSERSRRPVHWTWIFLTQRSLRENEASGPQEPQERPKRVERIGQVLKHISEMDRVE